MITEKLAKLKKSTALNEAEMQVAIGIMLDKGEQVREAQEDSFKRVIATKNLLKAQSNSYNEYVAIQAAVSGAKAESGRALRIQRMISEPFQSKDKAATTRRLSTPSAAGSWPRSRGARQLLANPDPNDKMGYYRFLRDHARFTTPQKIMAYWVNNILSGPGTIQRKLLEVTLRCSHCRRTFFARAARWCLTR